MHHLRGNAIPAGPLSDFLSDFYKIRHRVSGPYLHGKLHGCGFKNVGLHVRKSPKLVIFGITLPQSVNVCLALKQFLQNLAWGRYSQARTLMQNLTIVTFKMWAYSPKNPKLVIFGINFPKKGIPPYAIFIKFELGEGVPGTHLHAKFHRFGLKMWAYSLKNRNFWYTVAPKGKFRGSTEKVEYRYYKPSSMQRHHNCFENYTAS